MRITFEGHEFDLQDEAAMRVACSVRARAIMSQIPSDQHSPAFEQLLTEITGYHLKTGATIRMAHATGAVGISLQQVIDLHNYIGELVGGDMLQLTPAAPSDEPAVLPLVDETGEPILPGPPQVQESD